MRRWILAARPTTLIASISPVCLGMAFARTQGSCRWGVFCYTLSLAIALQIGANFANDYFDYMHGVDTPQRVGPVRVVQSGLIAPKQIRNVLIAWFIALSIACCGLLVLGGWSLGLLSCVALLCAWGYTGGPWPLSHLGLGEACAFPFFGSIALSATVYLQTTHYSWSALFLGITPGALAAALLLVNNLRDQDSDRVSHKRTLVVRWGARWGKVVFVMFLALALTPLVYFSAHGLCWVLPCIACLPTGTLAQQLIQAQTASQYSSLLPKTTRLFWLYTALLLIAL